MKRFRVALLQMTAVGADQDANLAKGEEFCRKAKTLDTDLALFPEMWNIGYSPAPPDADGRREWQRQALGLDGLFVKHFRSLAAELDLAIALTFLEEWDPAPRNSVALIDRHGEILFTYAKVHTCDFDMEAGITPGADFCVAALDTPVGPVQVGTMICYDREFPEAARILMLRGAEVILVPNSCTVDANRIAGLRTRAFENMVGIAMTNYAAPQCNGHSAAFDAVAYTKDERPLDTLIVEAGPSEGIYLADFDMGRIRAYRERETWGNAYRRPRLYGPLSTDEVRPPFIRPDARR
ncbi:MAG TPA: carbon-nitrogen hydrolase family protein [Actinomycetota bacterium]|nr:carbon-nitrogen hydrolase family protein [Actinomycetota bacterium]